PVEQYMQLCLTHPEFGYYRTHDPIGAEGDFVTAPEISQIFGELLGLWAATAWREMGSPQPVRLIELGPGRGTMLVDFLRAARLVPEFRGAILLHLVEINPTLQQLQRDALARMADSVSWHHSLEGVPDGPFVLLAN